MHNSLTPTGKPMQYFFYTLLLFVGIISTTPVTEAVPPPDFLFNVGTSIVQTFSVVTVFLSAIVISGWQFLKVYFQKIKHKKAVWVGLALVVVAIAFTSAYYYQQYAQEQAYKQWVAESKMAEQGQTNDQNSLDKLIIEKGTTASVSSTQQGVLGGTQQTQQSETTNQTDATPEDENTQFIKNYYNNIATGNLEEAYEVSKKSVSLATFKGWYKNVTDVELANLKAINSDTYSMKVTLAENNKPQSYAVLVTLGKTKEGQLRIIASESRTLVIPKDLANTSVKNPPEDNSTAENLSFYAANKTKKIIVSNDELKEIMKTNSNIYVLDAREDEEYEIGNFPNSHHIRFADLIAGEWIQLPTDKEVYVFCWSGMRGKEVAEFLRTKKIVSRYVENGASGWFAAGGKWNGGISFSDKHPEERYQKLFTKDEVSTQISKGTIIVDSRPKSSFTKNHIDNSINIPVIYTPSSQLNSLLSKVPAGTSVITVCDDFISCFDAKVTGIKLEKTGHTFLGRYNKPWEF